MSETTNTATIRVVADASGVEAGLRPAVDAARRAGDAVSQIGDGAAASARNVENAQRDITAAVQRTTAAMAQAGSGATAPARNVEASQRNIVAAIQRTTLAMESGGRTTAAYYEALGRQRGIDPTVLAPYIAQLRAVEEAQARATAAANSGSAALGHVGLSAAQINQELRFLPNRFQAIADSITAGQRPMTIAIQQGGELVTMFGGAGAAARAIGGYLLGLINPITVTAVAVGTLAVAYAQGAEEARKYTAALIMSGNAAGTSADKLALMAQHISRSVGTQGAAAEALAALAGTGKVSADNLESFGVVAIKAQRALGQSVADTAAQFADLAKSPVSALEKLNDQYHFLNSTVYEHVHTLQDQGRNYDAAQAAQTAWANAFDEVTVKVDKNLGTMQRGWRGVTDFAKGAWDAMLNVGREDTLEEKLEKVRKSIERASKPFDSAVGGNAEDRASLQANKELEASLERQIADRDRQAQLQAGKARLDAADVEWSKIKLSNLSRQQQLEHELDTVRNKGLEDGRSDVDINNELTKVRKKYADIYNAGIDAMIAADKRHDQVRDVLTQREVARINAEKALGAISENDAINRTADEELKAFDRHKKRLEDELALTKKKANSDQAQADLRGQIAVLDEQRMSRQIQRTYELAAAEQRRWQTSEALFIQGQTQATNERDGILATLEAQFQYNQEIGLSTVQVAELRAARLENAAALKDERAASLEALEPGSQLAKTYREQAQAMRDLGEAQVRGAYKEQMTTQWKQAVDQYGQVFQQGFADMLNHGKDGWHSFTHSLVTTFKTTVADQIYKMFARPIIVQLVGSYLGVSQQAIAGEIASQPNAFGITGNSANPISAVQAASSLYGFATGGMTLAGGLGTGFMGSLAGGLNGAGIGSGLTSSLGLSIGNGIADVVGSSVASGLATGLGAVATAMPWVAGALVIAGLAKSAFGMGDKKVTGQGISGTLSASTLTGQSYSTWHQDGGWFRSDRDGKDTAALTDAMVKQFTQGLGAVESAATGFASALGVQADWIKDYSKTFDLKLTGDATKDQQAITDFFNGIGDEIAKKLVPNLDEFSKSGETLSATLQRLAGDFQGTDKVAQLLGFSADSLFGSAGLQSAKSREQLIDLAGGLSVLSGYASTFSQNFLTDAERIKPVAEALDKALASLGLGTIPTTRDEFKALVDDLITSGAAATESGAKQLDSLLALSEAFAQVHPQIDAVAEAAAKAAAEAEKAAAAIQAIKDRASTMLAGVNDAFSVLQKVTAREKSAIQSSVDAHTAAFSKLQSMSQALHSTLDSLKSPDQKAFERTAAQAQIRAALAIAKAGGPLPDSESLKNALSTVTQDAMGQFSSYADYMRDLLQTQSDVAQLAGLTDDSLSVEQRSLETLKDQLARLDDIVANGQAQIDALNGQSVATLSLAQAMAALQSSIGSAQTNPVVAGKGAIAGFYQDLLGRAPDQAGMEYWLGAVANGSSLDNIRTAIMGSDEYKKLHPFAVGTNFVPETMPALVHQGERIIPAADNRVLMSVLARVAGGDNAALVEEVKALRVTVAKQQAALERIANDTREHKNMFDQATAGGGPLQVEIV